MREYRLLNNMYICIWKLAVYLGNVVRNIQVKENSRKNQNSNHSKMLGYQKICCIKCSILKGYIPEIQEEINKLLESLKIWKLISILIS